MCIIHKYKSIIKSNNSTNLQKGGVDQRTQIIGSKNPTAHICMGTNHKILGTPVHCTSLAILQYLPCYIWNMGSQTHRFNTYNTEVKSTNIKYTYVCTCTYAHNIQAQYTICVLGGCTNGGWSGRACL